MKYFYCLAWLGIALLFAQHSAAQDSEILTKIDEALKAVVPFEMGGDSRPLLEIEKIVFQLPTDSELRGPIEQKLIATLSADATTMDAKRFLCRQLRVIGTERCVPSLAKLLTDPQLSHMARYALGRLEVPAATEALLDALDKTSGDLQAGIIDTLGNRKCTAARDKLIELLRGSEPTVAKAAAITLGRLGDEASVAALQAARSAATGALGIEIDNALLNAAHQLAASGRTSAAASIYESFYKSESSQQNQFAGLRGLVITQEDQAAHLLANAMRAQDVSLRRFAISLIDLVPGRKATETFVSVADSLSVDDKVLLLRALGLRGDAAAAGAIAKATKDEDQDVRLAALEALGRVGDASIVSTLVGAAVASDGVERNVARAALQSLPVAGVNDRLLQLLPDADAKLKVELIHALAARGAVASVDELLRLATASDPSVRGAAINALGALADQQHVDALVELASTAKTREDQEAWIDAVGKVFVRVEDKARCASAVLAELANAPAASRPVLIRLLGKSASPQGLPAIRDSLKGDSPAARQAAVEALAQWPDATVSGDLLALLTDPEFAKYKAVALAGYLRLAAQSEDPGAMYAQAIKHVDEVDDKKAVLEGLGLSAESPQALDITLGYLDDAQLQAAAGIATMRIAYRLRQTDEARARDALKQVLAKVDHPDVQKRTREVLNELDKYEDHILDWVVAGPFQESGKDGAAIYSMVFPPETNPDGADWKPLTRGIGSWEVDLEATYGGLDFAAAYLRTRVWSDVEQDVQLEMGSDDGIKAWLNGKLLYDQWGEGGASPRQKLAQARLLEGWNDLMLKVVDQQGGWVGACRIRKPDGTALEGLKYRAE
jgi:HEAT repeat protein